MPLRAVGAARRIIRQLCLDSKCLALTCFDRKMCHMPLFSGIQAAAVEEGLRAAAGSAADSIKLADRAPDELRAAAEALRRRCRELQSHHRFLGTQVCLSCHP